ncbi:response regulator [Azorhizobium oxalatiphilum]|uniref:Response regulator n=1 Tax=Azorhizobium oxalatiphilum TaxID=980631 RepID=A0A917CHU2_9HYPH|nr:response regulator [Azorhizobium oxalatiphilum]GGF89463.1 response regulator [Azorhizobium oxalatiphilum]
MTALMSDLSVVIVDDDESVRESLPDLLGVHGFSSQVFSSGEEFLAANSFGRIGCVLLDIAMPGMSGPEVQQELKRRGVRVPVVFITAHGDDIVRPQVLALGAVDCLIKPFTDVALIGAVNAAFQIAVALAGSKGAS